MIAPAPADTAPRSSPAAATTTGAGTRGGSDAHTMTRELQKRLQHLDGIDTSWNVPLAGHTSLRVGGPVSCLIRPRNLAGLRATVQVLNSLHFPYFILGRGSNLLVADAPIRAAAISLESGFCHLRRLSPTGLAAGAGVPLRRLLRYAIAHGLGGMEFVVGIPGSVGGAVRMNAGSGGEDMAGVCQRLTLLDAAGHLACRHRQELEFDYRRLQLEPGAIVLEAEFKLLPRQHRQIRSRVRQLWERRRATQPWRQPSAGSVFKNPPGDSAGRLIEAAGLKGHTVGGAQISPLHANFIVNLGGAKAADVIHLIQLAQQQVRHRFGVELELELHLLGFPAATLAAIRGGV